MSIFTVMKFIKEFVKNRFYSNVLGWFGIRKNFCQFILNALPFLQEYGNISYHTEANNVGQNDALDNSTDDVIKHDIRKSKHLVKKFDMTKPVVPIVSIDLPD